METNRSSGAARPLPPISQLRKERPKAGYLARATQEGQQSRGRVCSAPGLSFSSPDPVLPLIRSVTAPSRMERMTLGGGRCYKTGRTGPEARWQRLGVSRPHQARQNFKRQVNSKALPRCPGSRAENGLLLGFWSRVIQQGPLTALGSASTPLPSPVLWDSRAACSYRETWNGARSWGPRLMNVSLTHPRAAHLLG